MAGITALAFVIAAFIATDTMAALPSESFQQEFLEGHNAYRAKHQVPPMTLNPKMSASAQAWADRLLALGTLDHSHPHQRPGQGENLYGMRGEIQLTGKEAVDYWYNEVKDYDWSDPGFNWRSAHFTQMVWKGSTELGVGLATDGHATFVVGRYKGVGNVIGCFKDNVFPLEA